MVFLYHNISTGLVCFRLPVTFAGVYKQDTCGGYHRDVSCKSWMVTDATVHFSLALIVFKRQQAISNLILRKIHDQIFD